jgi:aspartate/methionine/tyrosine aminotransferase
MTFEERMQIADKISQRSHQVQWSGIRVMFALADRVPDVINLGIGQPDFDTPEFIREAAKKALDDGYTRYPPGAGFIDLREAIAEKLKRENNITADPHSEIFVSVGAMQGVFNSVLNLVNPGEEVIVIDPGYDYYSQIGLFGGVPVPVPVSKQNQFQVEPDQIRKAITPRTKLIMLNSPSNPTGAILERETLTEIARIARQNEIMVVSDEPYEKIVFDGRKHVSIASLEGMKELTVSLFTLSKTYAMTGWRIGYVVAHQSIIAEMEKLMEHMVSSVTAFVQRAALAAISAPQDFVQDMLREYEKRRLVIYQGLNEIDGISCTLPAGTFYAFPNISSFGMTSWDFAKYLLQEGKVATIPGSIFGRQGEGHLRLSFAADTARLEEALSRIKKATSSLRRVKLVPKP